MYASVPMFWCQTSQGWKQENFSNSTMGLKLEKQCLGRQCTTISHLSLSTVIQYMESNCLEIAVFGLLDCCSASGAQILYPREWLTTEHCWNKSEPLKDIFYPLFVVALLPQYVLLQHNFHSDKIVSCKNFRSWYGIHTSVACLCSLSMVLMMNGQQVSTLFIIFCPSNDRVIC